MNAQQATPPPLKCEQFGTALAKARREPPAPRLSADVQLAAMHSLCHGWEVVDFWRPRTGGASWQARRKQMDGAGVLRVEVADSANCPALTAVLAELESIPVRLALTPQIRPGQVPPAPVRDGSRYELQMLQAYQASGLPIRVTLSGYDGPMPAWAERSRDRLAPCWRAA